ncbi:hypoxanthine phosphoribosyltransferase [Longibacter salinarum]|uniref:Hypoxanthine phosphoribosyltransferase n=1 Tax=Longibacter salinarum TaxID=1850348 RepID=A0A2A8CWE7_9BACT|nr:hypoxanthine phosphoribosyltransferase [Longibacter salinarum]PEN12943.1 hypoxanthine phosphoribosyltransferase [Longibacter salinarum]
MSTTRDLTEAPAQTHEQTITCRGERFRLYLDSDRIQKRIAEIGRQISNEYEGKTPILISVLNGAFMFTADLMRTIDIDCEVDFIKLSSYGDEKVSSGQVHELKSVDANLEGRDVIVIEDIVDTGLSMQFMMNRLADYNPKSVRVASLLHKPASTEPDLTLDYVGFEIPDLFVIGYGLDYGQIARNLPDIYILDEK